MRPERSRPRLLQAMFDAFRLPDLRRRILFTLGMLVVFRFIAHVPLPGVDADALHQLFERMPIFGMLDMFSGGAMRNFSVAAMGVYPYITASIIMMLLVPVIPRLQAISQELSELKQPLYLCYLSNHHHQGRRHRVTGTDIQIFYCQRPSYYC